MKNFIMAWAVVLALASVSQATHYRSRVLLVPVVQQQSYSFQATSNCGAGVNGLGAGCGQTQSYQQGFQQSYTPQLQFQQQGDPGCGAGAAGAYSTGVYNTGFAVRNVNYGANFAVRGFGVNNYGYGVGVRNFGVRGFGVRGFGVRNFAFQRQAFGFNGVGQRGFSFGFRSFR